MAVPANEAKRDCPQVCVSAPARVGSCALVSLHQTHLKSFVRHYFAICGLQPCKSLLGRARNTAPSKPGCAVPFWCPSMLEKLWEHSELDITPCTGCRHPIFARCTERQRGTLLSLRTKSTARPAKLDSRFANTMFVFCREKHHRAHRPGVGTDRGVGQYPAVGAWVWVGVRWYPKCLMPKAACRQFRALF